MARLGDKVALVTGAARGIGAAIVKAFIGEGARVWLTDVSVDAGRTLAAALGGNATFSRLDVREEADWMRVTGEIVAACGRLDTVVNNAGITSALRRK